MQNNEKTPLPLTILGLEFLGTVLIGLGLAKKFAGLDFLPMVSKYDESGWLFIGLGFLLTLPLVFYILARVREKAESSIKK